MFHIETKYLCNICVCVNLALDKPEHIDLVGQYKQRPTHDRDTSVIYDNYDKYINEGIHYFQIVPKNCGKLVLKGE